MPFIEVKWHMTEIHAFSSTAYGTQLLGVAAVFAPERRNGFHFTVQLRRIRR